MIDRPNSNSMPEVHSLQCMEIWGGIEASDTALSTPHLDAWLYAKPYGTEAQGGDIHYFSTCGEGMITRLLIADVAGHGQQAAGLALRLQSLLRKHINTVDQTSLIQELNQQFTALARQDRFATALVGTYFARDRSLLLCNAGHPRPLWYRAQEKRWQLLHGKINQAQEQPANLPLGIVDRTPYYQFQLTLRKGDLCVLYSDGLTETKNTKGIYLGEDGLLKIVNALDADRPGTFQKALLKALNDFRGQESSQDDVTVLTLHHHAGDPDLVCAHQGNVAS